MFLDSIHIDCILFRLFFCCPGIFHYFLSWFRSCLFRCVISQTLGLPLSFYFVHLLIYEFQSNCRFSLLSSRLNWLFLLRFFWYDLFGSILEMGFVNAIRLYAFLMNGTSVGVITGHWPDWGLCFWTSFISFSDSFILGRNVFSS